MSGENLTTYFFYNFWDGIKVNFDELKITSVKTQTARLSNVSSNHN